MSANVECMFYTMEKPWHGIGIQVHDAPTSERALYLVGLNWKVLQKEIYTDRRIIMPGYKVNIRDTDGQVLGIVSDRYKVIQNEEAFAFTDALLGESVRYETAGSLQNGKKVWMLAKLPMEYIIYGDIISPYLVFSNAHDGSGAVKAAVTPIRVVCNNTLNFALKTAKRNWSVVHTGDIKNKIQEAKSTLFFAKYYMQELEKEILGLCDIKITKRQIVSYIDLLIPMKQGLTDKQCMNICKMRIDLAERYCYAPDLQEMGHNAYRFINAVSDFATHHSPLRNAKNYNENLFSRTVYGNEMIDKAYLLLKTA